jgi:heptosyltransferase-3
MPAMNMFIHQAALGDFVVTWPLLRAWSATPMTVVSSGAKAKLAARVFPHVTPLDFDARSWSSLFAADDNAPARPAGAPAHASLVVSFVSSEGDVFTRRLRMLWPDAKVVCVTPRPPENWTRHVHDWHVHQLQRHGIAIPPHTATPVISPDGPIIIHPGAGSAGKRWPLDRFARLADALRKKNRVVKMILGEVELDQFARVDIDRMSDAVTCTSLDKLADLLAGARLFIGNDSGPTHLAAQLGLPTLALFGPTSPALWRPLGPSVHVHAPESPADMEWLQVEDLARQIDRFAHT